MTGNLKTLISTVGLALVLLAVTSVILAQPVSGRNLSNEQIAELRKEAKQGSIESQFQLGRYYYLRFQPDGLKDKDWKQAVKWLAKAASNGRVEALNMQGDLYSASMYVPPRRIDYDKALQFYLESALQGNAYAAWCVANLYRDGLGVEKSNEAYFQWLGYAHERGHVIASYFFAEEIMRRRKSNHTNAMSIPAAVGAYEFAASRNHLQSKIKLAEIYSNGIGIPQNLPRAIELRREVLLELNTPESEMALRLAEEKLSRQRQERIESEKRRLAEQEAIRNKNRDQHARWVAPSPPNLGSTKADSDSELKDFLMGAAALVTAVAIYSSLDEETPTSEETTAKRGTWLQLAPLEAKNRKNEVEQEAWPSSPPGYMRSFMRDLKTENWDADMRKRASRVLHDLRKQSWTISISNPDYDTYNYCISVVEILLSVPHGR